MADEDLNYFTVTAPKLGWFPSLVIETAILPSVSPAHTLWSHFNASFCSRKTPRTLSFHCRFRRLTRSHFQTLFLSRWPEQESIFLCFVRLSDILQISSLNMHEFILAVTTEKSLLDLLTRLEPLNNIEVCLSVCVIWQRAASFKDIWLSHQTGSGQAVNRLFRVFQASIVLQLLLGDPRCPQAKLDIKTQSLWLCSFPVSKTSL